VLRYYRDRRGLDADGDPDAIALFAFALVENDRLDWVDHYRANHNNVDPSPDQVAEWYRGKPESYFRDKERYAESWYATFARGLLRDEIEAGKQNAIRDALGDLRRFWPGFWTGNLVGLTSNLIFTLVVVMFVAVITTDFSFIAGAKGLFSGHAPAAK
jgi:hypothetical protein